MAKRTFNDYILECELYEHSQEYFNILKESSELDIMLTYLDNQSFLEEYASDLAGEGFAFTEGFFMEASSEDSKDETSTKAGGKVVSLFKTITHSVVSTFRMIFGFFKRLYQKVANKSTEKAQGNIGNINYGSLSAEDKERVKDALEDAWNNNDKYTLGNGESFDAASVLKSVLSGKFTIYLKNNDKLNDNTIISVEDFNDMVSAANNAIKSGKIKNRFKKEMGKTLSSALNKKRIEIDINPDAFKKAQEDLEKGMDIFEEMINSVSNDLSKSNVLKTGTKIGAGVAGAGAAYLAGRGAVEQFKDVRAGQYSHDLASQMSGTGAPRPTHNIKDYGTKMGNEFVAFYNKCSDVTKGLISGFKTGTEDLSSKMAELYGRVRYGSSPQREEVQEITKMMNSARNINPVALAAYIVLVILAGVFCYKGIKGFGKDKLFSEITTSVKTLSKNIMSTYQELIVFQNRAANNIARLNLG